MDNFKKNVLILFFILLFNLLITSCTGLSIATTGAQAVYNRRSIETTLNDQSIIYQAYKRIYRDTSRYEDANVSIAALNSEVLLTGEILDETRQKEILNIIKAIPGVKEIHNYTVLSGPSSPLTRISDSWITTKVKTKLLTMEEVDPSQIKVVTENGTVYLMGIIPKEQVPFAVQAALDTEGVQDVVKVFSYITISKV